MIPVSGDQVKQCSLDHQERQSSWRLFSFGLFVYIWSLYEKEKKKKEEVGKILMGMYVFVSKESFQKK